MQRGRGGCHRSSDSKIQTQAIDRMAAEGMRFTNAHTPSAVCTPTRVYVSDKQRRRAAKDQVRRYLYLLTGPYGLLTGRYCWRSPLKRGVIIKMDESPLITPDQLTVADLLARSDYDTAMIGKWHLGMDYGEAWNEPFRGSPMDCGFEKYFGIGSSLDLPPYGHL